MEKGEGMVKWGGGYDKWEGGGGPNGTHRDELDKEEIKLDNVISYIYNHSSSY